MVELLVTIVILSILAGLVFAVLGTTGTKARVNATRSTIAQIDRVLQERYQRFMKEITEQERNRTRGSAWDNILGNAILLAGSVGDIETAKVLIKQDRYRGWFPQRVGASVTNPPATSDLLGWNGTLSGTDTDINRDSPLWGRLSAYAATKQNSQGATASFPGSFTNNSETESAELLYFLVTEGADGIDNSVVNDINPRHVGDTDDDGLPEFLDDWGHPLRFYNAPTSMYSDPSVAAALIPSLATSDPDPLDPADLIRANINSGTPHPICSSFATNYHAPGTNFVPLIVSMGPDEELGLYEPDDPNTDQRLGGVADRNAAMDNITNRQTGAP